MDPDKENPPVNVEPDLFQYTKDRNATNIPDSARTAQETQDSDSPQPPLDPKLEQHLAGQDATGRWNIYKIKLAWYERDEKNLTTLSELI